MPLETSVIDRQCIIRGLFEEFIDQYYPEAAPEICDAMFCAFWLGMFLGTNKNLSETDRQVFQEKLQLARPARFWEE